MLKSFLNLQFNILNTGFCRVDSSWDYKKIISPFARLFYITSGEAYTSQQNTKYILKPGRIHLIPSYTICSYNCEKSMELYYVHFTAELSSRLSIFNYVNTINETHALENDAIMFQRLYELFPDKALINADPTTYNNKSNLHSYNFIDTENELKQYTESQGILMVLLSRFISGEKKDELKKYHTNYRLFQVIEYMVDNLDKPITLKEISDKACLSSDYFSRMFDKIMGVRPIEYLNSRRLEKAKILLLTTGDQISEIAFICGFNNLSWFNKCFKNHCGISPKEYRNNNLFNNSGK